MVLGLSLLIKLSLKMDNFGGFLNKNVYQVSSYLCHGHAAKYKYHPSFFSIRTFGHGTVGGTKFWGFSVKYPNKIKFVDLRMVLKISPAELTFNLNVHNYKH
jgi:hypothetical protein